MKEKYRVGDKFIVEIAGFDYNGNPEIMNWGMSVPMKVMDSFDRFDMDWISVNERMPNTRSAVLATDGDSVAMMFLHYDKTNQYKPVWLGSPMHNEITYWMPLPEAPDDEEV